MSKEENIYTHIEDTMSNIYLNGNMLNSGTVMVMLEEKDQRIKELEQQLAIYKRALDLVCEDISLYEDITTPELKAKCYLDQVKKELEETI